jgi:peptide/nickel transport system ATP-binding protein
MPVPNSAPVLHVEKLTKAYHQRGRVFGSGAPRIVVRNASFSVAAGETLGLVGESGSGKSTIGRAVLMLPAPTSGSVKFEGVELTTASPGTLRAMRKRMQMVFQDPYASLNPRMSVGDYVAEPLEIFNTPSTRAARRDEVAHLLQRVGLVPDAARRYPHQFSGGQRQRIAIAHAIALRPSLIVADEPIASLDVSIQAQIINLMIDLQDEIGLSYLFISHDLGVVRHICHRTAVLSQGVIVEMAPTEELFGNPLHPYTRKLIAAIPVPDPKIARRKAAEAAAVVPARAADAPVPPLVEAGTGHFVTADYADQK